MIKLKNLLNESSPGFENRQVGDPLPTLNSVRAAYQAKLALQEADSFTAINKDSGEVSVFKSKDSRDAAVKAGTHDKRDDKAAKGGDSSAGKDVPKVNIFDKPKEEPKSEPAKDSTGDRAGNLEVNKKVRAKAQKMGITPAKLGKEEYQKKMAQAAVAALTDANFHSEARQLVADLEGKPEMAEKPDYPKMDDPKYDEKMKVIRAKYDSVYSEPDDDAEDLGISAANEAGWDGVDALDSIAADLRKNGFGDMADKLQAVIKENTSTKLQDLV
jgi:hypothetical protein